MDADKEYQKFKDVLMQLVWKYLWNKYSVSTVYLIRKKLNTDKIIQVCT